MPRLALNRKDTGAESIGRKRPVAADLAIFPASFA